MKKIFILLMVLLLGSFVYANDWQLVDWELIDGSTGTTPVTPSDICIAENEWLYFDCATNTKAIRWNSVLTSFQLNADLTFYDGSLPTDMVFKGTTDTITVGMDDDAVVPGDSDFYVKLPAKDNSSAFFIRANDDTDSWGFYTDGSLNSTFLDITSWGSFDVNHLGTATTPAQAYAFKVDNSYNAVVNAEFYTVYFGSIATVSQSYRQNILGVVGSANTQGGDYTGIKTYIVDNSNLNSFGADITMVGGSADGVTPTGVRTTITDGGGTNSQLMGFGSYVTSSGGVGSETYGFYSSASGGATANYAAYFADGDVVIENDLSVGDVVAGGVKAVKPEATDAIGLTAYNSDQTVVGTQTIATNFSLYSSALAAETIGASFVLSKRGATDWSTDTASYGRLTLFTKWGVAPLKEIATFDFNNIAFLKQTFVTGKITSSASIEAATYLVARGSGSNALVDSVSINKTAIVVEGTADDFELNMNFPTIDPASDIDTTIQNAKLPTAGGDTTVSGLSLTLSSEIYHIKHDTFPAATTYDATIATLPARSLLAYALIIVTEQGAFSDTLVLTLGSAGAGYDQIVGGGGAGALDGKAVANTVWGDTDTERSSDLPDADMYGAKLYSWTSTQAITLHVDGNATNLDQVTAGEYDILLVWQTFPTVGE